MKKVIGLTGGIASGKSTVVDFLISLGYQVIDADKVVRELQAPNGKLAKAILSEFGSSFFDEKGNLKRKKLGALVFSDSKARTRLAEIQNAIIRKELYERRAKLLEQIADGEFFFMDIPLLLEQHYDGFDEVWLVSVSPEIQIMRLMERDHLDEKEAIARIKAQMSLEDKQKLATRIIDSSGEIEETRKIVQKYLQELS